MLPIQLCLLNLTLLDTLPKEGQRYFQVYFVLYASINIFQIKQIITFKMTEYQYQCLQLQTVCRAHRVLSVLHHLALFSASSRLLQLYQNQPRAKGKAHSAFANFQQAHVFWRHLPPRSGNSKRRKNVSNRNELLMLWFHQNYPNLFQFMDTSPGTLPDIQKDMGN